MAYVNLIIDKRNSIKDFVMMLIFNYGALVTKSESNDVVDRNGNKVYEVYVISFIITNKKKEELISKFNLKKCPNGDLLM